MCVEESKAPAGPSQRGQNILDLAEYERTLLPYAAAAEEEPFEPLHKLKTLKGEESEPSIRTIYFTR